MCVCLCVSAKGEALRESFPVLSGELCVMFLRGGRKTMLLCRDVREGAGIGNRMEGKGREPRELSVNFLKVLHLVSHYFSLKPQRAFCPPEGSNSLPPVLLHFLLPECHGVSVIICFLHMSFSAERVFMVFQDLHQTSQCIPKDPLCTCAPLCFLSSC